jgi:hypothetical protein
MAEENSKQQRCSVGVTVYSSQSCSETQEQKWSKAERFKKFATWPEN